MIKLLRLMNLKNPLLLLFTSFIAFATGCSESTPNNPYAGMDYTEVCAEFDKYALEQRRLLDEIRDKYKTDKLFMARFNKEQINWIQYQDSRLRSLYSKDWDNYYRKNFGNDVFNGCKCKELIRMSEMRNQELNIYLQGPDASQAECPVQGNIEGGQ